MSDQQPWTAVVLSLSLMAASVYFLGLTVYLVVAVLTLLVTVPLVLRHAHAEDKGEVDLTPEQVISRRGTNVLAWWERRTGLLIAGVLVGIPALVLIGGVLAILLFGG